uniref:UDP-galactose translocator (inferred by orthology to a human protein) n=1 Tax=Strongyloides venezuelensis TaxID=75913 RepID=A0A0K0G0C9_STRVS
MVTKVYWEENIMVKGNNNTSRLYDDNPKKYLGGEISSDENLQIKKVDENFMSEMSLTYSKDSGDFRNDQSFKDDSYCPVSQKSDKNELMNEKKKTSFAKSILNMKVLSLTIFVLLGTLSICSLRFVRFRHVETMYIASVGLVVGEVFKLLLSVIFLTYEVKSFPKAMKALYISTFVHWKDMLNTGIPAFLYAIRNLILQYAISYLDATLLLVTQQLKIFTTALFAILILKSKLSGVQWISMVVLIIGNILIQWKVPESKKSDLVAGNSTGTSKVVKEDFYPLSNSLHIPPQIIGLVMVFIGTVLSGFSGIFLEKIFKKTSQSIWCLNFQLAAFSVPIFFCVSVITDSSKINEKGLFAGFDWWVIAVYFLYGLHGMIVALLLKHASSILKCFASGLVIASTAVVSIFLFNVIPNLLLVVGTSVILLAVYLYTSFPYKKKTYTTLPQKCDNSSLKP